MDNIPPPSTTVGRQLSPLMRIPSLRDCFLSDGGFDVDKYLQRQTALRQRLLWRTSSALNLTNVVGESLSIGNQARGTAAMGIKKTQAPRCVFSCKESADLELQVIKPNECQWWKMYVENHFMLEDSSLHVKFWMQFRVPYANYLELLQWIRDNTHFACWCGEKINNKMSSPIQLLVLGLLRYLGRGWTFDDMEEQTAISKEVHRTFFYAFIVFGSTSFYSRFVLTPLHLPEALSNMREYKVAGFPGCIGSTDCTHITTERCEYRLKNNH